MTILSDQEKFQVDLAKWFSNIYLIFCLALLTYVLVLATAAVESLKFRETQGRIISSTLFDDRKNKNPQIEYVYSVNNHRYTGDKIHVGPHLFISGPGFRSAKKTVGYYHKGRHVSVYYNIDNPLSSILEPGFHRLLTVMMLIGIFFSLLGILAYIQTHHSVSNKLELRREMFGQTDDYQSTINNNTLGRKIATMAMLTFLLLLCYVLWPVVFP